MGMILNKQISLGKYSRGTFLRGRSACLSWAGTSLKERPAHSHRTCICNSRLDQIMPSHPFNLWCAKWILIPDNYLTKANQSPRWLLGALLLKPFSSGRKELTGCVFISSTKWKPLFLQHASGISASKWQRCMKLYMISFPRSKLRWMLFLSFISQLTWKCTWTFGNKRGFIWGEGNSFFESWWNPHIKGLGSSHTDSLGWAEGSIPVCRESNEAHKKNGFQDFELPFNV